MGCVCIDLIIGSDLLLALWALDMYVVRALYYQCISDHYIFPSINVFFFIPLLLSSRYLVLTFCDVSVVVSTYAAV
jgi:hypothetical protein